VDGVQPGWTESTDGDGAPQARSQPSANGLRDRVTGSDTSQGVGNTDASTTVEHASHGSAPFQTPLAPFPDPVEVALAEALSNASDAGKWDVVAQLARELEARRKASNADNVVRLEAERRTR
jgi:hypothetical protein